MTLLKLGKRALSRRSFVRGASATLIGLPLLEVMLDEHGEALAQGGSPNPPSLLVFFAPTSLGCSNNRGEEALTPTRTGMGYDFRYGLEPLAERGLQGDVSAVSGLVALPEDSPGGYNSDYHQYGYLSILTGTRSGFDGGPEGWRPSGTSVDQIAGQALGSTTRFDSLQYTIDVHTRYGISTRRRSDGLYDYLDAQASPVQAYRSLFTGFTPSDTPEPPDDLEERLRRSSLSYAREELNALQGRLGSADRQRLEEHLTQIRTLENRLMSTAPPPSTAACRDPMFMADPPELASSVPDQEARSDLFGELIHLAFACNLTRSIIISGSIQFTGSGMRHELWDHVGGLHGEVQHGGDQRELDTANRWFVEQYAKILTRFKDTAEGSGTMLDRTAALFVMEGGIGGRAGDGGSDQNHSCDNMLMLLAGRAGGLQPGQHVIATDRHPAVVLNTALQAVGVDEEVGEISGIVDELVG